VFFFVLAYIGCWVGLILIIVDSRQGYVLQKPTLKRHSSSISNLDEQSDALLKNKPCVPNPNNNQINNQSNNLPKQPLLGVHNNSNINNIDDQISLQPTD